MIANWIYFLAALLGTTLGMIPLYRYLRNHFVEKPSIHHLHTIPTPTGAGVVVVMTFLILAYIYTFVHGLTIIKYLISFSLPLLIIGWYDDRQNISITIRISVYYVMCVIALAFILPLGVLQGFTLLSIHIHPLIFWIFLSIMWFFFINFFNFMDGSDGMSGTNIVFYGVSIIVWSFLYNPVFMTIGIIFVGVGLGFLTWNWYPAKIFLGDTGSIPLGFLFGGIFIFIFVQNFNPFIIIISLYYWMDPGITLLLRILQGKKFYLPHEKHFFRQALKHISQHTLIYLIIALDFVLLLLAITSYYFGWIVLIPAIIVCILFLGLLKGLANGLYRYR